MVILGNEVVATSQLDELTFRPTWGSRLEGIEGLRGIGALSVLIAHVGALMQADEPGATFIVADRARHGLTLFFVLSGFLLWRPFVSALLFGKRRPSTGQFLLNRGLRIFPAYVVVLLVASFVFRATQLSTAALSGTLTTADTMGLSDTLVSLTLVQTVIPRFTLTGISPAWSLTTELTFYLLLPALFAGASHWCRKLPELVAGLVPAGLLVLVGLGGKTWLALASPGSASEPAGHAFAWGHQWSAVVCRSILVHGDLFGYGMVAALVYVMLENGKWRVRNRRVALAGAVVAVAVCSGIAALAVVPGYFSDSIMGLGCAGLLLAMLLRGQASRPSWLASVLERRPLRSLGLISYSIYLWHVPLIWWLQKHGWQAHGGAPALVVNVALVLGLTLPLATVTYLLVERPALNMRARTHS